MADKLIPGISYSTRISILQQSDVEGESTTGSSTSEQQTVLQHVMGSNEARNQVVRKVNSK